MVQPAGQLVGPKLWLVPRYTEAPGTIMRLGSILKDPKDLESSLNLSFIPPIPQSSKRDASTAVRRYVVAELERADSLFVKAVPSIAALFNIEIGASAGASRESSITTTLDAPVVRATVFIPSKEYMAEALKNETSLYIVVGTATASRLSVREKQAKGHSAEASAVAALPGGFGEAEASFECRRVVVTESQVEVADECDFAYRVREFLYSKIRGRLDDKGNVTESALFSCGVTSRDDGDEGVVYVPKFQGFEDEEPETGELFIMEVADE